MDNLYREFLIKAVLFLEEASGNLFAQILNIASHNEYSLLKESFESGDLLNVNIKMFEKSKDANILRLVKLYKQIELERIQLINLNLITNEELDHYFSITDLSFNSFDENDIDDNDELFGDLPVFLN